jgi:hypothetical protein
VRTVTDRQTELFSLDEYEITPVGDYFWEQEPLLPNLDLPPKSKIRAQPISDLLPKLKNREQDKKLLPILENREQTTENLAVGSQINVKGVIYILTHRRKPKMLPNSYGWMDIKSDKSGKNRYLCLRWREGGKQRSHHLVTRLNDAIDRA